MTDTKQGVDRWTAALAALELKPLDCDRHVKEREITNDSANHALLSLDDLRSMAWSVELLTLIAGHRMSVGDVQEAMQVVSLCSQLQVIVYTCLSAKGLVTR